MPPQAKKEAYQADILYGTNNEFGFDYLRDNSMVASKEQKVQTNHYFALVDEIDSILIDEARTPLIISGPVASSMQMYADLKKPVADLVKLQKDLCNTLASSARRKLDELGISQSTEIASLHLTKEQKELEKA